MEVIIFFLVIVTVREVCCLVDSCGVKQVEYGVVVDKKFTEGYYKTTRITETQILGDGKMIPKISRRTVWQPDSYVLYIRVANNIVNISVPSELYTSSEQGERIPVEYSLGRLLQNKVYIKKIGNNIMS